MTKMISGEVKGDILVVDDDLPALQLLSQLLAGHGYEVRSARDGSTALMIATADPPDLILLDIQMPGMDGYQVCEQLKLNPASRAIPVLFISAKDAVLDKIRGFDAGAVDYINKPYYTEEILARIQTHLTISRLHTKLTVTNTVLQEEVRMREQAQLALQASEASLRAQYQGIPIPTTTWKRSGADFILVDYNQAVVLNARSDVTDLLGVSAGEFFADQRNIFADMTACISTEKSIERELDYTYRSSGGTRTMAVKYAFVPPDLVLVHFEDVTERKQAEHQLIQRLNELSSLHQIAKTIAAKRELTQALELVCETINDLFDTQLTLIALQAGRLYTAERADRRRSIRRGDLAPQCRIDKLSHLLASIATSSREISRHRRSASLASSRTCTRLCPGQSSVHVPHHPFDVSRNYSGVSYPGAK